MYFVVDFETAVMITRADLRYPTLVTTVLARVAPYETFKPQIRQRSPVKFYSLNKKM